VNDNIATAQFFDRPFLCEIARDVVAAVELAATDSNDIVTSPLERIGYASPNKTACTCYQDTASGSEGSCPT
jgi:hypothetical protein